ncbi:MAG: adenosylhomocysteinase [Candidatus Hodarchaeales archaeon]
MDEGANYKVKDLSLAEKGRLDIEWAESHMPVLMKLRKQFRETKPLKGERICGSLHVSAKTAVLIETLIDAGAEVSWSGCNPLSTKDHIAAALAASGISIYAWYGLNTEEYYWAIEKTLEIKPTLTLDDGGDLTFMIHDKHQDLVDGIKGGTEETTTGVLRLRALAADEMLLYPIVAVNNAETKHDFDNVYGTGQSAIDGILRATAVLIAGKTFVISGYGHCGKGLAARARGMGAHVVITEVDPIQALKATLEGFRVMTMNEAAPIGDIFVTTTGVKDIITSTHFPTMKDGTILANAGHYDCEINIPQLTYLSTKVRTMRDNTEEYTLKNGRKIYLLAQGRLVNLAAGEGHPIEVMDMSFANQTMAMVYLAQNPNLKARVHEVRREQDLEIASLKLQSMGITIDKLSSEQYDYIHSYSEGT